MKARVTIHTDGDESAVLTAPEGHVRAMARLTQTGVLELIGRWMEAECKRPDFHPADALQALARATTQIQASLSGGFVKPHASAKLRQLLHETVDAEWDHAFGKAQQHRAGGHA